MLLNQGINKCRNKVSELFNENVFGSTEDIIYEGDTGLNTEIVGSNSTLDIELKNKSIVLESSLVAGTITGETVAEAVYTDIDYDEAILKFSFPQIDVLSTTVLNTKCNFVLKQLEPL